MNRTTTLFLSSGLLASLSGCTCGPRIHREVDPPSQLSEPTVHRLEVREVNVRAWPPLGPNDSVSVAVTGASSVDLEFGTRVTRGPNGDWVEVGASELGEGYGTLEITARSEPSGREQTARVNDLLIDLTPPIAEISSVVVNRSGVGPRGHLRAYVADAWVLGAFELRFAGEVFSQSFDAGLPSSIGETWDWHAIDIPSDQLPAGRSTVQLSVADAAGNTVTVDSELLVDGQAPGVELIQPKAGAALSGRFDVEAFAMDPEGEPVFVSVEIGGIEVGEAAGPTARLSIDASELSPGAVTLTVRATDRAGNAAAETIDVTIDGGV